MFLRLELLVTKIRERKKTTIQSKIKNSLLLLGGVTMRNSVEKLKITMNWYLNVKLTHRQSNASPQEEEMQGDLIKGFS